MLAEAPAALRVGFPPQYSGVLSPFTEQIAPNEGDWGPDLLHQWLDTRKRILDNRTHPLGLGRVINYFLASEGMYDAPNGELGSLLHDLKMNLFPLLPEGAQIKELGGSIKRLVDTDPDNAKFLGNLPIYIKQQTHHLFETQNPENLSEQTAHAVLEQIGTYALNTDHFLPLPVSNFGKVRSNLQDTITVHLERLKNAGTVNYDMSHDVDGTMIFTINKGAHIFFSGLRIPVTAEGLLDPNSANYRADFTPPESTQYQIRVSTFHPNGNANWALHGVFGAAINAAGVPLFYNFKYFFNPSIENNPELQRDERRESEMNVATDQARAITYGEDGIVKIPNTARNMFDWYSQPVYLPKLADDLPVMSYLSPLTRYLKRFFFMQGLPNGFETRFVSKNPDIFKNEGATNIIEQIVKVHKAGARLSASEQLEYYADIVLMASRDPIYFMTEFADLLSACLVNGKYLQARGKSDAGGLLSRALPYTEVAFPQLAHQEKLRLSWEEKPSAIESILKVAKLNGFTPSEKGLSIMAQFIELMQPGTPQDEKTI